MRKPNLTKGKWELSGGVWIVSDQQKKGTVACTANAFVDNETKNANAKAIAQVPNMIDALIELKEFLEFGIEQGYTDLAKRNLENLLESLDNQVKKVLLNAGCKL